MWIACWQIIHMKCQGLFSLKNEKKKKKQKKTTKNNNNKKH